MFDLKSVLLIIFTLPASASIAAGPAPLEMRWQQVTTAVGKAKTREARLKLVREFDQQLNKEIDAKANTKPHDAAYWATVRSEVAIGLLLSKKCEDVKTALISSEQKSSDDGAPKLSEETRKALDLAEQVCKK